MAVLSNFPLDYNDQISVIEIFDGLMRHWDAANSMESALREPIRSITDPPEAGFQRGSSDPLTSGLPTVAQESPFYLSSDDDQPPGNAVNE